MVWSGPTFDKVTGTHGGGERREKYISFEGVGFSDLKLELGGSERRGSINSDERKSHNCYQKFQKIKCSVNAYCAYF